MSAVFDTNDFPAARRLVQWRDFASDLFLTVDVAVALLLKSPERQLKVRKCSAACGYAVKDAREERGKRRSTIPESRRHQIKDTSYALL
jgi:hypothetical protein